MSIAYRMFSRNANRGGGGAGNGYGSDWTGPFLSPTSLDGDGRSAVGIAAFACAVRLVSETIGSFVMRVYQGDATRRQPVLDAPQASLLQDGAEGYCTSMDLWSDVATSVELFGNAFIWKGRRKAGGAVVELWPFPAESACVYVDEKGRKIIEARSGGEQRDVTKDVIHVRGWSPFVSVSGSSTESLHRRTLSGALALEEFRGRYFDNDSSPNLVLIHPGSPSQDQRNELRDSWKARHGGPKGDKTGILWGGMTIQQLTSTLEQSQVEQLMNLDVMQVARMARIVPHWLLLADPAAAIPPAENVSDLFFRFSLLHRIRRIERAVAADREVFPERALYSRMDVGEFVRGDTATTAAKLHQLIQVGAMSANEGRAELGLPPSEDPAADELQHTPVGGAPNANQQLSLLNGNGMHAELSSASEEGA